MAGQAGCCRACYHARVECIKRGPQPHHDHQAQAQIQAGYKARASGLPAPEEVDQLIDIYFHSPHYFCFYSFIHPEMFCWLHAYRQISMSLLLAMLVTILQYMDPDNLLANK